MAFRAFAIGVPLVALLHTGSTSMAGRRRPFSMLPYVAIAATQVLLVVELLVDGTGRPWGVVVGTILLTGLVVIRQTWALRDNGRLLHRLNRSLTAQEAAVARERVVAASGTALISMRDEREMYALAASKAAALLGTATTAVTVVGIDADGRCRVLAGEADGCRGVSAAEHAALLAWRPVDRADLLMLPLRADPTEVVALVVTGRSDGAVDQDPLRVALADEGVRQSLDAVCGQVTLGLESAALARELTYRAQYDMLTGLANRRTLRDHLVQAAARSRRRHRPVAILLIDLNGFKPINDRYGHEAGDVVLQHVAQRLRGSLREEDLAARLGGDEFAVVVEDVEGDADAVAVAERITAALAKPVPFGENALRVGASIGIAVADAGLDDIEALVRRADSAMYRAKAAKIAYQVAAEPAARAAAETS
jgi:diguanylate cyclase (GGDEF)-like protein